MIKTKIKEHIASRHANEHSYWSASESSSIYAGSPEGLVDVLYAYVLTENQSLISAKAAQSFINKISETSLYGRPQGERAPLSAHLTAYVLAGARLLKQLFPDLDDDHLYRNWDTSSILTSEYLPKWPKKWSHHSWRVSHWIGGTPSILLNLAARPMLSGVDSKVVEHVLSAIEEKIIEKNSGLLKAYKSKAIQKLFKKAYKIRHDPVLGELGGVVHVLWVNHSLNRDYVATENLFALTETQLVSHTPFMEATPYCLDFDIIQLYRTAKPKSAEFSTITLARVAKYQKDLLHFLTSDIPAEYTLHRIPGALASIHECALILGNDSVEGIPTVDIIKLANWL